MDQERFDQLARALGGVKSRRAAVRVAIGTLLGAAGLGAGADMEALAEKKKGKNQHKNRGKSGNPGGDKGSAAPTDDDVSAQGKKRHNKKKGNPSGPAASAICPSDKLAYCHCTPTNKATSCQIQCSSGGSGHDGHPFDCTCDENTSAVLPKCTYCGDTDNAACCPNCGAAGSPGQDCCIANGVGFCTDNKTDPNNCGACGIACAAGTVCLNGVCSCDSDDDCTPSTVSCKVAYCDVASGTCKTRNATDGTTCDDGNLCTVNDVCTNGVCGGSAKDCSAVADQCNDGVCDPANGTCFKQPKSNGTTCVDANPCNVNGTCTNGVCGGTAKSCSTLDDQCNVGVCDQQTGSCVKQAKANGTVCNDGNACTQTDTCQNGACIGSNPVVCTPLDQCHVAGTCDPRTGQCSNPNEADGTPCNDANLCTTGDACQAGACVGTLVVCVPSDQCHDAGICDPQTGQCSNPNKPNGAVCNDGDACTVDDVCTNGICAGKQKDCSDLDDQCNIGVCGADGTCVKEPKANGTTCSDGNACTTGETCQAGECTGGTPVTCVQPADPCLVAICDVRSGCVIGNAPDGTACEDGDLCTIGDTCKAGVCTAGASKVCEPLDACHVAGTCVPATGQCTNPAGPGGNACTVDETDGCCAAGTCDTKLFSCGAASPQCCASGTVCYKDQCCTPSGQQAACAGKCGKVVDSCGVSYTCNDCAILTCKVGTCGADSVCAYVNAAQETPCLQDGICCNGICCETGDVCAASDGACCTPAGQAAACAGKCGRVVDDCGIGYDCGACAPVTCQIGTCGSTTSTCSYVNEADGTSCGTTQICCSGECCAAGDVCHLEACCTPAGSEVACDGKCGTVIDTCGVRYDCGACQPVICKVGTCGATSNICSYVNVAQETPCNETGICCNGECCVDGDVCAIGTGECCTPATCTSLGKTCGSWSDGCGTTLNCGICEEFDNSFCTTDGTCSCAPDTCTNLKKECGSWSDGCGNTLECGVCEEFPNSFCATDGTCACTADTCTSLGKVCGSWDDGCGHTLECGACTEFPNSFCTEGGQCSCAADTCTSLEKECGSWSDGCGVTLECGTCTAFPNSFCDVQTGLCACTPATSCPAGQNCGTAPDGCGGTIECGVCTPPETCGGGGVAGVCGCTPLTCASFPSACGLVSLGCGVTAFCDGGCTPNCTPNCIDKVCGQDNGCGGVCTDCPAGETCIGTGPAGPDYTCCATANVCGTACCAAGTVCADPATGTCSAQVICIEEPDVCDPASGAPCCGVDGQGIGTCSFGHCCADPNDIYDSRTGTCGNCVSLGGSCVNVECCQIEGQEITCLDGVCTAVSPTPGNCAHAGDRPAQGERCCDRLHLEGGICVINRWDHCDPRNRGKRSFCEKGTRCVGGRLSPHGTPVCVPNKKRRGRGSERGQGLDSGYTPVA